ncbi:MAG: hypothetical protein MPJ50_15835 [Pirellulales bacterium]|nr:hypothetical protein [Pirellulales bacterium]
MAVIRFLVATIFGLMVLATGDAAQAQDPPEIPPPSFDDPGFFEFQDISPRVGVTYALGPERKTLLRASAARYAETVLAFTGGNVLIPLNDSPLGEWGGGITLTGDLPLFYNGVASLGPMCALDIFGQGFDDDNLLNEIGNLASGDRQGNDIFGANLRPGLIWRRGMTDRSNMIVNGGATLGYRASSTSSVPFDPMLQSVFVDHFKTKTVAYGYFLGVGLEIELPSGAVVRPLLNIVSVEHDLFTGNDRQETSLFLNLEVLLPRN